MQGLDEESLSLFMRKKGHGRSVGRGRVRKKNIIKEGVRSRESSLPQMTKANLAFIFSC